MPPATAAIYLQTLPWLLAIRALIFLPLGLWGGLWRYTGVWDLTRIVAAVTGSSAVSFVLVYQPLRGDGYPASIPVIDALLLICLLGGARLMRRGINALRAPQGQRVLVIGAGDAGEMIVREMRRAGTYRPVGFVDDDRLKIGRTIHGVTVLGTTDQLPRIVESTNPHEVLIAMPTADASSIRRLVHRLEKYKLPITTLPDLKELVNGTSNVTQIRPLAIEDLLPRSPIALDIDAVRNLVRDKRVLVTGAGGSIGSELCRQIASLQPATLIAFERYENSLYAVGNELGGRASDSPIHPVVGDVTDATRVEAVFAEHKPQIVFHAAAHKHVPLMEANPCEAAKNNVAGTRTLAEAACRHGSERFVLISTDKAVNPSSVMGATKRVAELIVQAIGQDSVTRFVTVRFGNVLGSNGSVIPRMLEQIRLGGPVTVTHPDVRRYFMLLPEAVELVLQAAVLARDRAIFVLDMGEQLKVLDVAKNLIRLAGYIPEEEIPIRFVGLRPGEKLTEELVGEDERLAASEIPKVFQVRGPAVVEGRRMRQAVDALVRAAKRGDVSATVTLLLHLVPTFTPSMPIQIGVPDDDVLRRTLPRSARERELAAVAVSGRLLAAVKLQPHT